VACREDHTDPLALLVAGKDVSVPIPHMAGTPLEPCLYLWQHGASPESTRLMRRPQNPGGFLAPDGSEPAAVRPPPRAGRRAGALRVTVPRGAVPHAG